LPPRDSLREATQRGSPARASSAVMGDSPNTPLLHIVKNLFRHKKLRYRGLAKNTAQLHTLFALANLVIVKKALLAQGPA
jgi:IS5 family transposase